MARLYPSFIYSDPKNTKSTGPFIVHLLQPRLVLKVITSEEWDDEYEEHWGASQGNIAVVIIDEQIEEQFEQTMSIIDDAHKWLLTQIRMKAIKLPFSVTSEQPIRWKYHIIDDGGMNSFFNSEKPFVGNLFIAYDHVYEVAEINNTTKEVTAYRRKKTSPEEIITLPSYTL